MILLYGLLGPNVAKARAALLLKKIDFKHVNVDLINPSTAFFDLSPIGKVPFIQDEGAVVHDSLFIAEYLDRKYPKTYSLFPNELADRVQLYSIISLLDRMYTTIAPIVAEKLGFYEMVGVEHAACSGYHQINDDLRVAIKADFEKRFHRLSDKLQGKNYFFEDRITQADIAVVAFLSFLKQVGFNIDKMEDWLQCRVLEAPFNHMFATGEEEIFKSI